MTAVTKFNSFTEALAEKVHNLGSDTLKVVLCNAANAPVATNTVLANLTTIDHTNLSARTITTTSSAQTSGTYKLILADLTLTASGTVPAFRYVVIYNDTATNDELIGWIDLGSETILYSTETITLDFDGTGGAITLA